MILPSVSSLIHTFFPLDSSSQDPSFSLLLHDKLQVPNSSQRAWNERDSRCDVCATHLTQLKQEAVRMVLTLDQWDLSPTSSPPALIGPYGSHGLPGQTGAPGAAGGQVSQECSAQFLSSSSAAAASLLSQSSVQSPSPGLSQTPTASPSHGPPNSSQGSPSVGPTSSCASTNPQLQGAGHRLGSKPRSLGLGAGAEKRSGSPISAKSAGAQQQPLTAANSPSNNGGNSSNNSSGAVLSTAALQAHQHQSRTNGGVTLYPYQVSIFQMDVSLCLCALVLSDTQSYFFYKDTEDVAMETEHEFYSFYNYMTN